MIAEISQTLNWKLSSLLLDDTFYALRSGFESKFTSTPTVSNSVFVCWRSFIALAEWTVLWIVKKSLQRMNRWKVNLCRNLFCVIDKSSNWLKLRRDDEQMLKWKHSHSCSYGDESRPRARIETYIPVRKLMTQSFAYQHGFIFTVYFITNQLQHSSDIYFVWNCACVNKQWRRLGSLLMKRDTWNSRRNNSIIPASLEFRLELWIIFRCLLWLSRSVAVGLSQRRRHHQKGWERKIVEHLIPWNLHNL